LAPNIEGTQIPANDKDANKEIEMHENTPRYAIAKTLSISFEEADQRVRGALQDEGFGVLTEIDVKATLKKKLDVTIPKYEILGACNPPLAHQALQYESDIGLLLPCNVVVRETGDPGVTIVEALDPVLQLGVAERDALQPLALEVQARLKRALESVAQVG
jgi:uncharacterized protein (DUF302 family)